MSRPPSLPGTQQPAAEGAFLLPHGLPHGLPLYICDATFREGQQAGRSFTVEQMVRLYDLLHRLGGPDGFIRSSEFFCYTPKDRRAVEACRALGHPFPRITGWARATRQDLLAARELEMQEVSLLMSVSPQHMRHKFGWTDAEATTRYLAVLDDALSLGLTPRCHFEDVTRADVPGFCIPLARGIMDRARDSGRAIIIRLCDTLGLAMPYAGAVLPLGVEALVRAFVEHAGVPGAWLEFHGHNDFHRAHANTVTAWLVGCAGASASLLGLGERAGTASVEGLAAEYRLLAPERARVDLHVLGELVCTLESMGVSIPEQQPLLGGRAFAHVAGLHLDGLRKAPETYEAFDPGLVLGRQSRIIITDKSGRAGVAAWLEREFGMPAADKEHPLVTALLHVVTQAGEQGRAAPFSNGELRAMALLCHPPVPQQSWHHLYETALRAMEQAMTLVHACQNALFQEPLQQARPVFHGLHLLHCTDSHGTYRIGRWGCCTLDEAVLTDLPLGAPGLVLPCLEQGRLGWVLAMPTPEGGRLTAVWDLMTFWPQEDACPGS